MRNSTLLWGALPLLAILACSGGVSTDPDRYNGALDTSAFDTKFLPITSSASTTLKGLCSPQPCYPAQVGYAHGKQIKFYNVLNAGTALRTKPTGSAPPPFCQQDATGVGCNLSVDKMPPAYNFPHSCSAGHAFNPVTDAFSLDQQFPIMGALPLATTVFGAVVSPVFAVYSVDATGNVCNDLKSDDSIEAGDFNAKISNTPVGYQLWAMVDPTANFVDIGGQFPGRIGWYKGLQGAFLDGGRIPTETINDAFSGKPVTQLRAQDGVILNGSSFANAFDNKAVILAAQPGEDAYSPVVRLRQFTLPGGKSLGDYTDLCPVGASTCASNQVPMGQTTDSFNTIFIIATPQ